jgi:hypothetical protein
VVILLLGFTISFRHASASQGFARASQGCRSYQFSSKPVFWSAYQEVLKNKTIYFRRCGDIKIFGFMFLLVW